MIEKYGLDYYVSHLEEKSGWFSIDFNSWFNGLSNLFFSFTKQLWQVFDVIIQVLGNKTLFNSALDRVYELTKEVYSNLFSVFGIVFIGITLIYCFISYYFGIGKNNKVNVIGLIVVLFLNYGYYVNGNTVIKNVSDTFDKVELIVSNTLNSLVIDNQDKVEELNQNNEYLENVSLEEQIQKNEEQKLQRQQNFKIEQTRENLFRETVLKPFTLLNFNSNDFKEEEHGKFLILSTVTDYDAINSRKDEIKKYVNDSAKTYKALRNDNVWNKFFTAFFSIFNVLLIGGFSTIISVVSFILKISVVGLIAFIPFISIMSLIPIFQTALYQAFGKIISVLFSSTFISIVSIVIFYMLNLIDVIVLQMLPVNAKDISLFVGLFVKGVFLFLIYHNKSFLVSFMTGGLVSTPNIYMRKNLLHRLPRRIKNNKYHDDNDSEDNEDNREEVYTVGYRNGFKDALNWYKGSVKDVEQEHEEVNYVENDSKYYYEEQFFTSNNEEDNYSDEKEIRKSEYVEKIQSNNTVFKGVNDEIDLDNYEQEHYYYVESRLNL